MKHDKLLRFPKRFCVECDRDQYVYAVEHKTFEMYHCQQCRAEIGRMGDGRQKGNAKKLASALDTDAAIVDGFMADRMSMVELASQYPELMSDEHAMWPQHDTESNIWREDAMRTFKAALSGLTARQKQVLDAVRRGATYHQAAIALGIKQETIKTTLENIRKKLLKVSPDRGRQGLLGEGTIS